MIISEELKKNNVKKKLEKILKSQNILLDKIIIDNEIIFDEKKIKEWDVYSINKNRIKNIVESINKEKNKEIKSYLDFGCNNAIQSDVFFDFLKIKTNNYYGIDIENTCLSNKIKFLKYTKEEKIPIRENKIDLVTCMMSLHHVDDVLKYLREIYRILSKDGILFIRESNITNYEDFVFNQIIDKIYSKIIHNKDEDVQNFKSIEQWLSILLYVGFKIIKIEKVEEYNYFSPYHLILKK